MSNKKSSYDSLRCDLRDEWNEHTNNKFTDIIKEAYNQAISDAQDKINGIEVCNLKDDSFRDRASYEMSNMFIK